MLGIDGCDTARNVGADKQLDRRRRALVVKGRLARAAKRTKRVRQLRKAGAHTRNLTLTGSNAGVLNPSESTRPKPHIGKAEDRMQPQRCWPTPRQTGKKHRSGVSTSSRSQFGLGDGSLGRHSRPRHHAGRAARHHCQARPPEEAVVRRHGRSGHLRAHASAAGPERTVRKASHSPQRHEDRPPGGGAEDGGWIKLP